ncbi:unnamed protein product [Amoebophrya sp. A120]|nr:unnamed protein product [Amoebophrya sp. A120]|eukprot:GSA120T00006312001.1
MSSSGAFVSGPAQSRVRMPAPGQQVYQNHQNFGPQVVPGTTTGTGGGFSPAPTMMPGAVATPGGSTIGAASGGAPPFLQPGTPAPNAQQQMAIDRRTTVHSAFIHLVVHLIGLFVVGIFYLNYFVLESYFLALFWATVASIPMFEVKKQLFVWVLAFFLSDDEEDEDNNRLRSLVLEENESSSLAFFQEEQQEEIMEHYIDRLQEHEGRRTTRSRIVDPDNQESQLQPPLRSSSGADAPPVRTTSMSSPPGGSSSSTSATLRRRLVAAQQQHQGVLSPIQQHLHQHTGVAGAGGSLRSSTQGPAPAEIFTTMDLGAPISATTSRRGVDQTAAGVKTLGSSSILSRSPGQEGASELHHPGRPSGGPLVRRGSSLYNNRSTRLEQTKRSWFFSHLFGIQEKRWWSRYESFASFFFRDLPILIDLLARVLYWLVAQPLVNFVSSSSTNSADFSWPWFALLYRAVLARAVFLLYKADPDLFDPLGATASFLYFSCLVAYSLLILIRLVDGLLNWLTQRRDQVAPGSGYGKVSSTSGMISSSSGRLAGNGTKYLARASGRMSSPRTSSASARLSGRGDHDRGLQHQQLGAISSSTSFQRPSSSRSRTFFQSLFQRGRGGANTLGGVGPGQQIMKRSSAHSATPRRPGDSTSTVPPLISSPDADRRTTMMQPRSSSASVQKDLQGHSIDRAMRATTSSSRKAETRAQLGHDESHSVSSVELQDMGLMPTALDPSRASSELRLPAWGDEDAAHQTFMRTKFAAMQENQNLSHSHVQQHSEIIRSCGQEQYENDEQEKSSASSTPDARTRDHLLVEDEEEDPRDERGQNSTASLPAAILIRDHEDGADVDVLTTGTMIAGSTSTRAVLTENLPQYSAGANRAGLLTTTVSRSGEAEKSSTTASEHEQDQQKRSEHEYAAAGTASATTNKRFDVQEDGEVRNKADFLDERTKPIMLAVDDHGGQDEELTSTSCSSCLECVVDFLREIYIQVLATVLTDQIHTLLAIFIIVSSAFLCAVLMVLCAAELSREIAFIWQATQEFAESNELFQQRVLPVLAGLSQAMHVVGKKHQTGVSADGSSAFNVMKGASSSHFATTSSTTLGGVGLGTTTATSKGGTGTTATNEAAGRATSSPSSFSASDAAASTLSRHEAAQTVGKGADSNTFYTEQFGDKKNSTRTLLGVPTTTTRAGPSTTGGLAQQANANLTQYYNEYFSGWLERNMVEYEFIKLVYDAYSTVGTEQHQPAGFPASSQQGHHQKGSLTKGTTSRSSENSGKITVTTAEIMSGSLPLTSSHDSGQDFEQARATKNIEDDHKSGLHSSDHVAANEDGGDGAAARSEETDSTAAPEVRLHRKRPPADEKKVADRFSISLRDDGDDDDQLRKNSMALSNRTSVDATAKAELLKKEEKHQKVTVKNTTGKGSSPSSKKSKKIGGETAHPSSSTEIRSATSVAEEQEQVRDHDETVGEDEKVPDAAAKTLKKSKSTPRSSSADSPASAGDSVQKKQGPEENEVEIAAGHHLERSSETASKTARMHRTEDDSTRDHPSGESGPSIIGPDSRREYKNEDTTEKNATRTSAADGAASTTGDVKINSSEPSSEVKDASAVVKEQKFKILPPPQLSGYFFSDASVRTVPIHSLLLADEQNAAHSSSTDNAEEYVGERNNERTEDLDRRLEEILNASGSTSKESTADRNKKKMDIQPSGDQNIEADEAEGTKNDQDEPDRSWSSWFLESSTRSPFISTTKTTESTVAGSIVKRPSVAVDEEDNVPETSSDERQQRRKMTLASDEMPGLSEDEHEIGKNPGNRSSPPPPTSSKQNTTSEHQRHQAPPPHSFSLRELKQARALLFELFRGNFTQAKRLSSEAFNEVYSAYQSNRLTSFKSLFQQGAPGQEGQQGQSPISRFLQFVVLLLQHWLATFLEVIFQGIVFICALFYMLKSRVSVMHYFDEFLAVIDSSRMCYSCVERVLNAILYSAVKMCVFYTLYTWFICSFFELPLVFIPTIIAGIMALIPVVDPIYVAFLANFYVYWNYSNMEQRPLANSYVYWNYSNMEQQQLLAARNLHAAAASASSGAADNSFAETTSTSILTPPFSMFSFRSDMSTAADSTSPLHQHQASILSRASSATSAPSDATSYAFYWASICFLINLTTWWNVTVAIYMEIPESNPWLTGLGVVLGISHFGVKGVVLGPVLVVIPLLCYELLFVFNNVVVDKSSNTTAALPAGGTTVGGAGGISSSSNSSSASASPPMGATSAFGLAAPHQHLSGGGVSFGLNSAAGIGVMSAGDSISHTNNPSAYPSNALLQHVGNYASAGATAVENEGLGGPLGAGSAANGRLSPPQMAGVPHDLRLQCEQMQLFGAAAPGAASNAYQEQRAPVRQPARYASPPRIGINNNKAQSGHTIANHPQRDQFLQVPHQHLLAVPQQQQQQPATDVARMRQMLEKKDGKAILQEVLSPMPNRTGARATIVEQITSNSAAATSAASHQQQQGQQQALAQRHQQQRLHQPAANDGKNKGLQTENRGNHAPSSSATSSPVVMRKREGNQHGNDVQDATRPSAAGNERLSFLTATGGSPDQVGRDKKNEDFDAGAADSSATEDPNEQEDGRDVSLAGERGSYKNETTPSPSRHGSVKEQERDGVDRMHSPLRATQLNMEK